MPAESSARADACADDLDDAVAAIDSRWRRSTSTRGRSHRTSRHSAKPSSARASSAFQARFPIGAAATIPASSRR